MNRQSELLTIYQAIQHALQRLETATDLVEDSPTLYSKAGFYHDIAKSMEHLDKALETVGAKLDEGEENEN